MQGILWAVSQKQRQFSAVHEPAGPLLQVLQPCKLDERKALDKGRTKQSRSERKGAASTWNKTIDLLATDMYRTVILAHVVPVLYICKMHLFIAI